MIKTGLNTFSCKARKPSALAHPTLTERTHLKLSVRSSDGDGHVVAHDLRGNHRKSLALGRVHLSRHDRASRLVLRETELSESAPGSGAEVPDVVGDLHKGAGEDVESARGLDDRVVCGESLELVGGGEEGEAGDLRNLLSDLDVESGAGVESLIEERISVCTKGRQGENVRFRRRFLLVRAWRDGGEQR